MKSTNTNKITPTAADNTAAPRQKSRGKTPNIEPVATVKTPETNNVKSNFLIAPTQEPVKPVFDSYSPAQDDTGEESVHVFVRIRPLNDRELSLKSAECWSQKQPEQITLTEAADSKEKTFTFDKVFPTKSTQVEVYEATGKKILRKAVVGFNACVFCYGQTGSGILKKYKLLLQEKHLQWKEVMIILDWWNC